MKIFKTYSKRLHRPLKMVPYYIIVTILLLLTLHIAISNQKPLPEPDVEDLSKPLAHEYIRLIGFGDEPFLSRAIILWIQMHDYQQGISLAYRDIDYQHLAEWLELSIKLDPGHDYPLLLASRVYGMVNDVDRQRIMLNFVADEFRKYPEERWQWLAHAVYMAKYRVNDNELALRYARLLADRTRPEKTPKWARQMHVFILADMGDVEAARILLGGLYESGQLNDEQEYRFLLQRIEEQEKMSNMNSSSD